ncbi:hypothetical protein [Streptomyces sp. NPDC050564]|uniref:hypothetical protein n=1 Tax=Streptomyces sp. NPDC050564 TaxID=3365631 RepID=UPI003793278C
MPPARPAEAMAVATSAMVGGQALAVALTGRLAESCGPTAAFAVGSALAAPACALALTARPTTYTETENDPHARVHPDNDPHARVPEENKPA